MVVCNSAKYNQPSAAITINHAINNHAITNGVVPSGGDDVEKQLGAILVPNAESAGPKPKLSTAGGGKSGVAVGSPTEVAMLNYATQLTDIGALRSRSPVVFEIPFNSRRKCQTVIIRGTNSRGKADQSKVSFLVVFAASFWTVQEWRLHRGVHMPVGREL